MIVEIRGVGFHNQGAALMLEAVLQHFQGEGNTVRVASQPLRNGHVRRPLPLLQKLPRFRIRRSAVWSPILPRSFRRLYGLVRENEIEAVLDASGFAFGDQWGPEPSEEVALQAVRWKRQGKKIVFLPQAFGPYTSERIRSAFRRVLDNADMVFARDRESYRHVCELNRGGTDVRIAPDFTNLVPGALPNWFAQRMRRACIVPNIRMLDKTPPEEADSYIPMLATCIRALIERDVEPFLLVHSTGDAGLVSELQSRLDFPIDVVQEENALHVKGILGSCFLVVASRYHALVSALSQGVPCLGTGWSHKYPALFDDYDCPECLISPRTPETVLNEAVERLVEDPMRGDLVTRLETASQRQREQAMAMWNEVDGLLNLPAATNTNAQPSVI